MQAAVIAAQYDDAAVSDDYGVSQRRVSHHTGRDAGQVFRLLAQRPDFGAQLAQAHLHEAVVEVGEHHVVPTGGEGCVEDDGTDLFGVGMGESIGTLRPATGERRQIAPPPWFFTGNGNEAAPVDPLPAGKRQHSRAMMAVIGSGVARWMPLLEAIRHVQTVSGRSIENVAAVVIAAPQSGVIPSRRSGPEGAMPLDGRHE